MNQKVKNVIKLLTKLLPDKVYIKLRYKKTIGKRLSLNRVDGYNEKLQWLKIYDHNPDYKKLVDKYEVKKYIVDTIGKEYIIPTLGVWEKFDDIDFDKLPNQFVLKCTHDSGGLVIVKDKNNIDIKKMKDKINKSLSTNYYWHGREWPYKGIKPRIIAEKYMEDSETEELRDYKFFCFDGKVKALYIATDRQKPNEDTKFDFFDENFNHLPFEQAHPNAKVPPKKPINFEKMKELASVLSAGIPHVRIDFYEVNGKIYFGEMTFYHMSGFSPFVPEEWDYKLGEWLTLPEKKK